MAMVNYPYPTNFVNDLPAWPVDVSCKKATAIKPNSTWDYMAALAAAGNVFYNSTGKERCLNITSSNSEGLDASGWNILACNEMVMP